MLCILWKMVLDSAPREVGDCSGNAALWNIGTWDIVLPIQSYRRTRALYDIVDASCCVRHTRWPISSPSAPCTLLISKNQFQSPSFSKEFMPNPVFCINLSIQFGTLDEYVLISCIEINVSYCRCHVCCWRGNADRFEKWRND